MRFTDGFWMLRQGVTANYPAEVANVSVTPTVVTVLAPTAPIRHRSDTLNLPVVTIELWSPMPDVLGVRIGHWTGAGTRPLGFDLVGEVPIELDVAESADAIVITSGGLSASVDRRPGRWGLEFFAGDRVVTATGSRHMAIVETDDGPFVREQLELAVGELVYGLGERFGAFVKNGQTVDIWNADGGTSSEQAYKNVPFYVTNKGYGVLVNDTGPVSFEVGSEAVSRVQFSVPGQFLEYFVIGGPTPKDVLRRYTALTGRPARPPAWSFGLWLSTSFTTSYDEATVTGFVDGMAERGIPLSVFHFDCFWMRQFRWCDFEWDPDTFPDPEGMLRRLRDRGLRVCVWINPYIAQASPLFEEARRLGHLLQRPDGSVWQWDLWQAGMAIVDFTSAAAREWFASKLRPLLDMGVDCFKTDFGERIPTDVAWADGSDPVRMHNLYTQLYNRTVFELLEEERGAGEAVLFARSATAGGQRFPVHWGGDCTSSFVSMAETLRGGLSLAMSGFGFWSHDIGGFEGTPDAEVFKRWVAFGLLSTHSRLHGSESYRVPWAFDDEAVEVTRHFARLKERLMPYIEVAADEAHEAGIPVMRPMVLEFPDDPACAQLDRQYMLGPDLLVAPVFSPGGEVEYYVPEGRWTRLLGGDPVDGPGWRRERHDAMSLPLLIRPGAGRLAGWWPGGGN
jgi:alpha-D-xyloside xylohydrolase